MEEDLVNWLEIQFYKSNIKKYGGVARRQGVRLASVSSKII